MKKSRTESVENRRHKSCPPIVGPIKAEIALGYTHSGQFHHIEIYFFDREDHPVTVDPRRIAHADVDAADWSLRVYDWHDPMWTLIPGTPTWNEKNTRLIYTLAPSTEDYRESGTYFGLRIGSGLGIGHKGDIEVVYENGRTTTRLLDTAYWILKPGTTGKDVIKVALGEQLPQLIALYDIASANEPYYSRAISQLRSELSTAEQVWNFLILFADKGPLRLPLVYAALSKMLRRLPVERIWNIIYEFYKVYQGDRRSRIAAIRLLGELGAEESRSLLRDIRKEESGKSKKEVIKALAADKERRAILKGHLPIELEMPKYLLSGPPEIYHADSFGFSVSIKDQEYRLVFNKKGLEWYIHLFPRDRDHVHLGMVAIEWHEDTGNADIKGLRIFPRSYTARLAPQFKYLLLSAALRFIIERLRVHEEQINVLPCSFTDNHSAYDLALLKELGFYPDENIKARLAKKVQDHEVHVRVLDTGGIKMDRPFIGIEASDLIPLFLKGKKKGKTVDDVVVTDVEEYHRLSWQRGRLAQIMQTQEVYLGAPHHLCGDGIRSLLRRVPEFHFDDIRGDF